MTSPRNFGRLNLGNLGIVETSLEDGVGRVRVVLSREVAEMAASIFRFDSISFAVVALDFSILAQFHQLYRGLQFRYQGSKTPPSSLPIVHE